MPQVVPFLVKVGTLVTFGAATGTAAAVIGGIAVVGTFAASRFLKPKLDLNIDDNAATRSATVRSTTEAQKRVYGETLVSGPITYAQVSGTNNRYLHQVIALAGHELTAIDEIRFDEHILDLTNSSIYNPSTKQIISGKFGPKDNENGVSEAVVYIDTRLGAASQTAYSALRSDTLTSQEYLATHRGDGIASVYVRMTTHEGAAELWDDVGNPRNIRALVRGAKVYDPRLEVNAGGTAGASPTNANYVVYDDNSLGVGNAVNQYARDKQGQNPALIIADLLMNDDFGLGIPASKIDWSSVITAADKCDQLVVIPTSSVQKRFFASGVVFGSDSHRRSIEKILMAMDGDLLYSQGKYIIKAGVYEAPTETFTENDVVSAVQVKTATPRQDRYNQISGLFIDPNENFKMMEFGPITVDGAYARDNSEVLPEEIKLPFTSNRYAAQRLAWKKVNQSFAQTMIQVTVNLKGMRVRVGDRINLTLTDFESIDSGNWSPKIFKVISWGFAEDGSGVDLTLIEDASAFYADPDEDDYSTIDAQGTITTALPDVPSPSSFTATSQINSIKLDWTNPANNASWEQIWVFRNTTGTTPTDSDTPITRLRTTSFTDQRDADGTEYYYWIQAVKYPSGTTPSSGSANKQKSPMIALGTPASGKIAATKIGQTVMGDDSVGTAQVIDGNIGSDQIATTIQSNNWHETNQTGWKIQKDGNAYFNEGAFRGTVTVGGTDLTSTNTLNSNTTASDVGLGNVDNTNSQTTTQNGLISGTTITGGGITLSSGGVIKGGQTGYNDQNNAGFFLGYDSNAYKLSIGNGAAESLTFDGSTLSVRGTITADSGSIANSVTVGGTAASTVASNAAAGNQTAQQSSLLPRADDSEWVVGDYTSKMGIWVENGADENEVLLAQGPHGDIVKVWKATSTDGSDADGGFFNQFSDAWDIESDTVYRLSVFVKQSNTNGNFYFGAYNFTSGGSNVNLYKHDGTGGTTNKYWQNGGNLPTQGDWYLAVGYINPSDTNISGGKGGLYDVKSGEKKSNYDDWRFSGAGSESDAAKFIFRTYQYYAVSSPTAIMEWAHPRVDRMDRRAPSIAELLRGWTDLAAPIEEGVTITGGGITMSSGGSLKGGQTGFDTGTGFFLGYDTNAYKLSIGDSSSNSLTFNGTDLAVTGSITAGAFTLSSGATLTDSDDQIKNTNNNAFFRHETTAANDDVSALSDTEFNTAFGRNPRNRDILVVVNTASNPDVSAAYVYDSSLTTPAFVAKNDFLTGDILVDGTITANHLSVNSLSAISADMGSITAGSLNINNGAFAVTGQGVMSATGATVSGAITATSLTLSGTSIAQNQLASGVQTSLGLADSAIQNDTVFAAKIAWGYDEDVQGWAGTNITATHNNEGYVNLASTTNDPQWSLSSQSIDGRKDHIVRVRIKRTAGTSWHGTLYYSTSGHGFSESYRKTITDSTVTNQWVVLEYDMSSLTAGGTDWTSNTITGLRFDWGNTSSDTFQVDWIAVGSVGSTPVREGGDVISGSVGGINIDSSKLYSGNTGTWQNANTGFYLDDTGKFSLKDKLFFDPSNNLLTVDGNITADVITAKQNLVVLGDLEASSVAVGSITRAMLAQSALDEIFGSLATSVGGSNGDFKEGTGSFTTSGGSVTLGTSSDKFDHGTASVDVEFHINTYFYSTTNYTTAQAQATLTFEATADGTFNDLNSADKTHTLQFLEYDLSSYYGYTYLVYYLNTAITKTFTSGSGNDLADNVDVQFRVAVSGVGSAFTGQTLSFEASANEGVTGVTSTGGNADTLDNLDSTAFLRSNVDDTFDGTLTITGDLILQGGIDQYNVTNLDVTDKTITVNNGGTQSLSDGAGLIIDRGTAADASITWDESGDKFDFTNQIAAPSLQIGTTLQEVITSARVLQNVTANAAILTSGTLPSARLGGDVWKNRGSISVTTTSDGSQHNPFDDAHSETKVAGYGSYRLDYTGATAHMISSAVGGSASVFQIGAHYNGDDFYMRVRTDSSNWKNWRKLFHDNYHPNADKWTNARTVSLTGFVTGSFSLDGTADATLATTASIDVPRTFTLPNTGSNTNQWIYIGRATGLGQHGASVSIRLRLSNGYNASNAQNVEGYIRFKTSNASSNQSGFYGDAQLYRFGQNVNALQELKVVQASNSTSEYQFYILVSSFTGEHSNYTVEQSSGAWTHVGTFSGSAPTGTLITESPRRIFTSGFAQNDNLDLGTGTATANGFNIGATNVISSARGLSVTAITNTGLMSTKTITVIPQGDSSSPEGGEIRLQGSGSNETINIDNYSSIFRIFDGSVPQVRLSLNSSGDATFAGTITGTSVHSTGNSTFDQITLKPTSGSGTGGGRVLDVHYTGDDRLAVISTDQSSGSLTIGYGAESGNVGAQSFKSTFDNFSGKRSAVTFRNDSVKFWGTNANVQTAVGSALQTMVNRITLHTDDGSAEFDGGITADGPSVFNPTNDMIVVNEPSTNTDLQTVMRVGTSAGGLYLTTNNAIIGKGAYYDGQWIATDTTGAHIDFTGSNRITFSTFSGATVGGTAAFGSRAYIDSNGLNVTGHIGGGSGHIVGKFAVKSTGVHASYDLYNNGTSYFNGAVTVDDRLYISGTTGEIRFGNTVVIDPNRVVKNITRAEFANFAPTGTTTTAAATIRYGNLAANVEGSHMSHPYFFNDLGNFENRGGVITTGGLNFTPSYTNCFRPNPSFASWGNSNYTGSTMTITLTSLPHGLSYTGYIGIAFGNTSWCPSSCKIEVSTNGGTSWTTRLNDTTAKELYFTSTGAGGSAINAIRFTLGQAANTTSIRVTNIWAYNYNSKGMDNYFLNNTGGTVYGKLTINNPNFATHLELVRGNDTLYLTPSGGQLMTNGGLSPDVTNQDDLGRSDKYWQDLWLGTSLKMGGTTVVDSNRNLTNIVNFTNTHLITNRRTTAFSPNDSGAGIRLEYSGGDASGDIGSGIVFAQRWYSQATTNVRTGGIAGFKGAGSGSFGGGLKFYTQPQSGADMNVALTLDRNTNAQFAGTISSGAQYITSTGGATNALSIVNSGANGGYFNVSSNVGGVSTDGSVGLHIGWNKSNGGREINMIFDGGTAQTDTEMIFTSTDGSTYSDIFQINGGGNVDIKSGGLRIGTTTAIDSNRRFYASDGSAGAPAFSFSADTDTGFYRYTTNQIGFAISGSHRGTIDFHALRHFGREYQLAEKEVMRSQALAAPSNTTQRHRRTILEVSYNSHHWMQVGVFKIRVETTYPIGNEYAEYLMHVGYLHTSTSGSQGGSGTSVNDWVISRVFSSKVSGNYDHELIVGTPTDTGFDSGGYDIYKVPIYLENDHYAQHRVTIEAPQDTFTRVTSFSGQNQFIFMPSYTATVLTGQVVNPLPNTQAIYGILYGHTKYDRSTTLTDGTGSYVSPSETDVSAKLAGKLIAGGGFSPTGSAIGGVRAYGNTNAYMSAADQAGRTAFFGVDSSGYAMFGALTNHDAVIRANNQEKLRIKTNGVINIASGGTLTHNNTTILSSSRALQGITSLTQTGQHYFAANNTANLFDIRVGSQTTSRGMQFYPYATIGTRYSGWDMWLGTNASTQVGTTSSGIKLVTSFTTGGASILNVGFYGMHYYSWNASQLSGLGANSALTLGTAKFSITGEGNLQIGGQTVISASRVGQNFAQIKVNGTSYAPNPDANMYLSANELQFGGNNASRETNSAQISAAQHQANSLNFVGMSTGTNSATRRMDFWVEGGAFFRGTVTCTGNITAFGSASDVRLKTGVKRVVDPIAKLKAVNGYTFQWNENAPEEKQGQTEYGVIAQEVEAAGLDELVFDYERPVNDTGGDKAPPERWKAVHYDKFVPILIEAVKAQQETIESLTKRIEELEDGDN